MSVQKWTINGKFRGECPVDLQVASGTLKLSVIKPRDAETMWEFQQDIRIGEGSVKKIEVWMHWRFTDSSLKRMNAPIEQILANANKGFPLEQYVLGYRYSMGKDGVTENSVEALKWYRKAADQGYALAQNKMSSYYYDLQDYTQSLNWSLKAANQGDPDAQSSVGSCYEKGWGVIQNCEEAMKWFRRAADQGDQSGFMGIGRLYQNGCSVTVDENEAAKWYGKAAAGSDAFTAQLARDALNYLLKH